MFENTNQFALVDGVPVLVNRWDIETETSMSPVYSATSMQTTVSNDMNIIAHISLILPAPATATQLPPRSGMDIRLYRGDVEMRLANAYIENIKYYTDDAFADREYQLTDIDVIAMDMERRKI